MTQLILFEAFRDMAEIQSLLREMKYWDPDLNLTCEARRTEGHEFVYRVTEDEVKLDHEQFTNNLSAVLTFEKDVDAVQFKMKYAGTYEILEE